MFQPLPFIAIDLLRGMDSLRWCRKLRSNEKLSYETLENYQITKLKMLLEYASKRVPFYIDYFNKNHLKANDFNKPEDLQQLPIVTKKMFRKEPLRFRSLDFRKSKVFKRSTSGATGEPFIYYLDRDSFSFNRAARLRSWEWFGYRIGEKYSVVSGGALINDKVNSINKNVYNFLENRIAFPIVNLGETTSIKIIKTLNKIKPKYILAYPSLLYSLSKHMEELSLKCQYVEKIVTTSECLQESVRLYVEKIFNAEVYDFYGLGDGTLMACECEKHDGFHYFMEGAILECVDETGRLYEDGITGRLISTSLTNFQMPFLRYETGDMGSITRERCSCGRGSARINEVIGRDRDQILCEDGTLTHGASINKIVSKFEWVNRFQVIQKSNKDISILIDPRYNPHEHEQNILTDKIKDIVGHLPVSIVFTKDFILTNSGKFRAVISEIIPLQANQTRVMIN